VYIERVLQNAAAAQPMERWRPRRLAWLRLAASPGITKIYLVNKRRFARRFRHQVNVAMCAIGSETQPSQPARTPALR
jgi:hypothetical protein